MMTYAIVYDSQTGNTALLAERIRKVLPAENLIYFGAPSAEALRADILFVGSWTDKGTCCEKIAQFLKSLQTKRVFLFGTAGFGGSAAYVSQIGNRMAENLSDGNVLLGTYLCQGKMPLSVRARYEALSKTDKEKAKPMLENFDRALSHPDQEDLEKLENTVIGTLATVRK